MNKAGKLKRQRDCRSLKTIELNKTPSTSNKKARGTNKTVTGSRATQHTKQVGNVTTPEGFIILCSANALSIILSPTYLSSKAFHLIYNKDYWHKFIVINAGITDREQVLKRIMDTLYPLEITPVMCRDDGVHTYFLVNNCGAAIEKLCRMNMIIDNHLGSKLILQIVLGFATLNKIPLNIQENLLRVIRKRFNENTKHLDLSNFHRDPELINTIFYPLSISRILRQVLIMLSQTELQVKSLCLANNEIVTLKNVGNAWQLKPITRLDLRNNWIRNVSELMSLKPYNITEVLLDQNPFCENYDDEYSYIMALREPFPNIEELDGVILPAPGLPRSMKCFFNSEDDRSIADQFVRHYFTLYDSGDRKKLEGLYHNNALFSLSVTYISGQCTSYSAKLAEYRAESRNLLKLSDFSKNKLLLYRGSNAVLANLCKLSNTEHDPYSFTVDLVHCPYGVIIPVSGVFRERLSTSVVRSFHRVFVLVKTGPTSFQIVNDMLHIKNATTKQVQAAFRVPVPIALKISAFQSSNPSEYDKDQLVDILSQLTNMNKKWSWKCLDETKWNFKEALIIFTELYKFSKIPSDAFIQE